jgi:hypothetical protein
MRALERDLPVFLGSDQSHTMAKAEIYKTSDKVLIQITASGDGGRYLSEFLEQNIPIGLSFNPIPIRDIMSVREKRETI